MVYMLKWKKNSIKTNIFQAAINQISMTFSFFNNPVSAAHTAKCTGKVTIQLTVFHVLQTHQLLEDEQKNLTNNHNTCAHVSACHRGCLVYWVNTMPGQPWHIASAPSRAKPGVTRPVQDNETPSRPCHHLLWSNTLEKPWTGARMSSAPKYAH